MRSTNSFKKHKLLYFSPIIWKKIFLYKKHPIFKISEKKIYCRSSTIPFILNKTEIKIYSGKSWFTRVINKWMIGFKFGEFTWNRKMALYKAKQLKKKKKK